MAQNAELRDGSLLFVLLIVIGDHCDDDLPGFIPNLFVGRLRRRFSFRFHSGGMFSAPASQVTFEREVIGKVTGTCVPIFLTVSSKGRR
jgi:hypothetical protein